MLYLTLFFIAIFIANILVERRTLWSGITFGLASLFTLIYLIISLENSPLLQQFTWINTLLLLFISAIAILLLMGPLLLELTFLYNGIKILRREGISLKNALSLGIAIMIPLYLFFFPKLGHLITLPKMLAWIPTYIGLVFLYLVVQASLYTLASLINLINIPQRQLDYIIVLGAGLMGKEVTPLLASRINKAISLHKKYPNSKLIMSGGQGADEAISEAEAMTNYALKQGLPAEAIILEDRATNTDENIRFSYLLMKKPKPTFAIVTNSYHLFRALLIARREKLSCIGYGAASKFYFSLNAFVREFIAYLVMTRNGHISILGILLFLILLTYGFSVTFLPNQLLH